MVDRLGDMKIRSWQIQLTVAEPDVLLQPYDMLELHPMLADAPAVEEESWPGVLLACGRPGSAERSLACSGWSRRSSR